MNISEDSSDGITLDDVDPHISETVPTDTANIGFDTPNDLVLYLVVNPNSSEAGPSTTATGSALSPGGVSGDKANVNLNTATSSSDDTDQVGEKSIEDATTYTLGEGLAEIDSSQHLISEFGHDEHVDIELDSATEEITVGNDAALTDTLPVEDSITSQLLQPGLAGVDSDTDVTAQDKQEEVPRISTEQIVTPSTSVAPVNNVGVHQLVTIQGQTFILFTGPADQQKIEVKPDSDADALVDNASECEEPPGKKIRLERLTESPPAQPLEDLQEMSEIALTVPEVPLIQQDVTSQETVSNKHGKATEDLDVTQTWFTTKDDKVAFQNTGQTWKQGQWSKDEIDVLQANIAEYCKERKIYDPAEVIFVMTKEERKNFYRTISRGLNRPLFSVYRRVIRMYDSTNHIGKYSPEELEKLKILRKKLGTDWAAIGTAMGRSPSSVKDRCRLLKDQCNSGKWLPEEEKRLAEAVQRLTGMVPGESVTTGLSWAAVAEQVGTRSEKQCRTKWLNYLNWKQRGGTEWNRADDLVLIDKIYNLGVTEENQINWENLAADWTSARSPQWLRGKWWSLKRHVNDYQLLTFAEIIDYLKANNRTIIRGSGTNDSYAVKLPTPMTISLTLPLNVNTVSSANTIVETSTIRPYQYLTNVSQVINSDSNCDQNILQTLTQQQMVEMQPGGGQEFINSDYSKTQQTLVVGVGNSNSQINIETDNLKQKGHSGQLYIQDVKVLGCDSDKNDPHEHETSPTLDGIKHGTVTSHGGAGDGIANVIVQRTVSSRSQDVFSVDGS